MKRSLYISLLAPFLTLCISCTKTESDFSEQIVESIQIRASTINTTVGSVVHFTVISSTKGDITADSKILVNDTLISGNSYQFKAAGTYSIYAKKNLLTSSTISINVITIATTQVRFEHKVLVEEYSGTWCGNCPRILYGVDLLHKQTDKAIVVGIHLFGNDPFITQDGNNLAREQNVNGVPTGIIGRTTRWNGPEYENVNQVISTLKASSITGIAITSSIISNKINISVNVGYGQPITGKVKLHVFLVEDKLLHTQSNYSSNLYGGASSIQNFEYNGVLRKILSALSGDTIPSSGVSNEQLYTFTLPSPLIRNTSNLRIVAFTTNEDGNVLNAEQALVGQIVPFKYL